MFLKKKLSCFIFSILTLLLVITSNKQYVYAEDKISTKVDIEVKVEENLINIKEKWRLESNEKQQFTRKLDISNEDITNFNAQQIFPQQQNLGYKINDDSSIVIDLPKEFSKEIVLELSYTLTKSINKNIENSLNKILFSKEQPTQISLLNLNIDSIDSTNTKKQYKNIILNNIGDTEGKNTKKSTSNISKNSNKNVDKNFFKDLLYYMIEFVLISSTAVIALIISLVGIEFYKYKSRQNKRTFKSRKKNFNTRNKKFKKSKNTKFKK